MGNFYVYMHINAINGEPFYIGKGTKDRFKTKSKRSNFWKNIVNKYGYDIIFLEVNLKEEEAFEKERYWIQKLGRRDLGTGPLVNHSDGGDGPLKRIPWNKGIPMSEEAKKKLSENKKGNIPWNKNKTGYKNVCSNKERYLYGSNPNSKIVLNLETGIYYDTLKEAAESLSMNRYYLSRLLTENKISKLIKI